MSPPSSPRLATTFRIIADDVRLAEGLADHAYRNLGVRSVAIVDDRTAYGGGIADVFERQAKALGMRVTTRQYVNSKTTDFSAVVGSITGQGAPDLVFYGGMDSTAGPLIRQMGRAGLRSRLMGGDGICSGELPRWAGGELTAGQVVCAEAGGVESPLMSDLQRFHERYKQRFQADVQVYAPYAYDAVMVLADAMARAGSAEPAQYLPALARTQFRGVTGPIAFDERGDIRAGAFTTYTYRGARREQAAVVRLSP